ncbi:MAG: diadenylate cyclase CdaA [Vicinamibacteria bacterium]|jgi:diadenylate cyclase|nr:diadenylate cyclase CdaA [Vicinamibacteria bacterium]MBP9947147.1 diadenylate cyclase CdaA [Vicinamibacteria bacterium]
MFETFQTVFGGRAFSFRDAIDLAIVGFLVYRLFRFVRGTQATHIVLGALGVVALFATASLLDLRLLGLLLSNVVPYVAFAAIVVFQAEIRKLLASLGRALFSRSGPSSTDDVLDEIVLAAQSLASARTGALIVFERDMGLKSFAETGVRLDAAVTYDLLCNIFTPGSPLHDGAVVVQADRLSAAACFLPLTVNPELSRTLGSRHRAAIGVTEDTDAVALVVSEETGRISLVSAGDMTRLADPKELSEALRAALRRRGSVPARHRAAE